MQNNYGIYTGPYDPVHIEGDITPLTYEDIRSIL